MKNEREGGKPGEEEENGRDWETREGKERGKEGKKKRRGRAQGRKRGDQTN